MEHYIDAVGKACPQPVILARQALDAGQAPLTIAVDNPIAVENLKRLAAGRGITATAREAAGHFEVAFGQAGQSAAPAPANRNGYAVLVGKDHLGEGDPTLGYNLMKMLLYTLSQEEGAPASVLFINGGVRLPAGEEAEVLESLHILAQKGAALLVCGTCLNYYGLTDALKVGTVSNMYDILAKMRAAEKVITL